VLLGGIDALTHTICQCQRPILSYVELFYRTVHRAVFHGQRGTATTGQDGLFHLPQASTLESRSSYVCMDCNLFDSKYLFQPDEDKYPASYSIGAFYASGQWCVMVYVYTDWTISFGTHFK